MLNAEVISDVLSGVLSFRGTFSKSELVVYGVLIVPQRQILDAL